MASPKRSRVSGYNASEVSANTNGVDIHGVLTKLSPVKQGTKCKYFNASLEDGKVPVRITSFQEAHHDNLKKYLNRPVILQNVDVREGSAYGLQILTKKNSSFRESPKVFNITADDSSLCNIKEIAEHDTENVSFVAKVINLEPCVKRYSFNKPRQMQHAKLSDSTGSIDATLWGATVGTVDQGRSYEFLNMQRSIFEERHTVQSNIYTYIREVKDIGEVFFTEDTMEINCEIMIVSNLKKIMLCQKCAGEIQDVSGKSSLGRCIECKSVMKYSVCAPKTTATITVQSNEGEQHEVLIEGDQIVQLTKNAASCEIEDLEIALLSTGYIRLTVEKRKNIVTKIIQLED